eukprot:CAMPEP_0171634194 /NCGR_PEP_ID=MMETSP0990-20121206/25753_1 /TAXON_ID=483369 /ORGANISM="non described non described, Strain CCMP2098" /LENGTH=144 /DNA_ID=CAMNT_0012205255 /DNA_START=132 /DNA_END=566 /DNA_ORIENTATION=-
MPVNLAIRGFAKKAVAVKKPKPGDDKASPEEEAKGNKELAQLLAIVDSPRREKPDLPEDIKQRNFERGRRYNVETTRVHNHQNWKVQMQLDLKNAAMSTLPPEQYEYALDVQTEDCAFPLDFRHPMVTPPIKDFNPDDYAGANE